MPLNHGVLVAVTVLDGSRILTFERLPDIADIDVARLEIDVGRMQGATQPVRAFNVCVFLVDASTHKMVLSSSSFSIAVGWAACSCSGSLSVPRARGCVFSLANAVPFDQTEDILLSLFIWLVCVLAGQPDGSELVSSNGLSKTIALALLMRDHSAKAQCACVLFGSFVCMSP
jgi:hypothetical protein